jgi:hypothetical protein
MNNLHDESTQDLKKFSPASEYKQSHGDFSREIRLSKNSCPLCNFVQKEIEKDNSLPVEEWIYLAHLRNAHGIEP